MTRYLVVTRPVGQMRLPLPTKPEAAQAMMAALAVLVPHDATWEVTEESGWGERHTPPVESNHPPSQGGEK